MFSAMALWPMLLDMTRDECKRILRRLELEAYGSLVSALRAQGVLSKDKRKLLQDLAATLNISMERHRAEVRRAVNDEKLATIAEHIAGPNTATDWAIEGRRLIPLMPRLVPQTAFTALANNVANIAAAENSKLPTPSNTVKRSAIPSEETTSEPSIPEASKVSQRSASPIATSTAVPNLQAKKDEEDERNRKRRRSLSIPNIPVQQQAPPLPPAPQPQPSARTVAYPMGVTPVKITLTTPPHPGPSGVGNIVTISTNPGNGGNLTATTVSIGGIPTTAYITSQANVPKIRPKSVQLPAKPRPRSGSIVIPVTPNQLAGGNAGPTQSLPNVQGVQLKTALHSTKPSVHIKQDSMGMKIMPVSSVGSATKILPKPSFNSGSQAPVYVMSATTASVSVVTRTVPASSSPRVVTVNTTSSTVPNTVSHIRPTGSTFITKSSQKPIQALHISAQNPNIPRPTGGKPNVIVVQKGSATGFSRGVTLSHGGKEVVGKVIMSKSLTSNMQPSPVSTVSVQKPATIVQSSGTSSTNQQTLNLPGNVIVLDLSTALPEWIQMESEGRSISTDVEMSEVPEEEAGSKSSAHIIETSQKTAMGEMALPMDVPSRRVVTLEEAVELLGHSDTAETRALLSQAGIQVTEAIPSSNQENISTTSLQSSNSTREVSSSTVRIVPTSASGTMDIFSTALASADINLDSFQYIEEDPSAASSSVVTTERTEQNKQIIHYTQSSGTGNAVVVESISKHGNQLGEQVLEASIGEHLTSFLQPSLTTSIGETTAVTVEPSNMDTTGMHIEDFTSQKVQGQDIT
ncbi:hypothetical protein C0J52_16190 [Blattella germanica]|nr:hypothetical protein C0J52_16190 [Blattella germanica]